MAPQPDLTSLRLTAGQLTGLRDQMRDGILAGLRRPDQEIRALPAYLRRPAGGLTGRVVVLDVGGTHMRAGWVELTDGVPSMLGSHRENELMHAATARELSAREFFDAQAELIAAVCPDRAPIVSYCFSYPATIAPDGEAVLIEWTKGIRIRDVEGKPVGALLREALRRDGKAVARIPVLNDTVASLLAAAALASDCDRHIGAIVATGTNMAGFFPVQAIAKLNAEARRGWQDDALMAVNLESGDYTPRAILTPWDDALDNALPPDQQKRQRLEKAVSGAYLPRLFYEVAGAEACAAAGFDPAAPGTHAGTVVDLRDDARLGPVATALIDRSADLIATGLAALMAAYDAVGLPAGRTGILVEGNLYHMTPGYADRVAATLSALAPGQQTVFIATDTLTVSPNMLGAASAALS